MHAFREFSERASWQIAQQLQGICYQETVKRVIGVPLISQDHRSAIAGHPARSSRRAFHSPKGSLAISFEGEGCDTPPLCSATYHSRSL